MNTDLRWYTEIVAVDINTGEIISPKLIEKQIYEITKKTTTAKVININGTNTGKKTITWHCTPKQKRQFKLF